MILHLTSVHTECDLSEIPGISEGQAASRRQIPTPRDGSTFRRFAILGHLLGRHSNGAAEFRVFVTTGELDQPAASETVAVSGRLIAIAELVCIDEVSKLLWLMLVQVRGGFTPER